MAEPDLVGQGAGKRGQQVQACREDTCYGGRLYVVESQDAAKVKGDDNEHAVVCGTLEEFHQVRDPEGFAELDFFFLCTHNLIIVIVIGFLPQATFLSSHTE